MIRSKQRRDLLVNALANGEVNVEQMALQFQVSPSTIRRDLQFLSQNGAIQRTYGGAVLNHQIIEDPFIERMEKHGDKKRLIAESALDIIKDGTTIILDAGSTVLAFGRLLIDKKLRIITNNLMLVPILSNQPNIELIILGGLCRPTSMGTFGSLTLEAMEHVGADYLFTSADGIVAGKGLCEASLDQTVLKKNMIARAHQTIVLADSSKINRAEQHAWVSLPSNWILISDEISKADQISFEATGAQVICASRNK